MAENGSARQGQNVGIFEICIYHGLDFLIMNR
jgi:hypothetical protein